MKNYFTIYKFLKGIVWFIVIYIPLNIFVSKFIYNNKVSDNWVLYCFGAAMVGSIVNWIVDIFEKKSIKNSL
ncbi:MAG: hypothetical protein WAX44_01435 [Minisyncoccia bacterium]